MSYGEGRGLHYKTVVGGFFSLMVLLITVSFFGFNMLAVEGRKATNVLTTTLVDYFDETVTFTHDDGFAIAFAVYNFFDPLREIDYTEYYAVKAQMMEPHPV